MKTRFLLFVFTYIVYVGLLAAQTIPPASNQQLSPEELRLRDDWRVSMAQVPAPKRGCFQSDYPSKEWQEVACVPAPNRPMLPKRGPRPLVVGNGDDISAQAPTGLISTAIGSFDSVTNVTSESSKYGMGNLVENAYTLQLNTNFFNSTICSNTTDSLSQCAWEQFIYENNSDGGFGYIQYWVFSYKGPCPTGWNTDNADCWRNSTMSVKVPNQAITNLGQLSLSGTVNATGDSVHVSVGSKMYMAMGDNTVDAAVGWQIAEFNVVGDCCYSQAVFNNGAQIVPRTKIVYGGTAPPNCSAQGFTGETNNLSFGPTAPPTMGPGPAVIFTESTGGGAGSNCAAATTVGDTHLNTFQGLFYDFQASGDFVLVQQVEPVVELAKLDFAVQPRQVAPLFIVQARQVSGAPQWPNATVNHGIATQMGQTKVAVCLTEGFHSDSGTRSPVSASPEGSLLNVNGENIALGDGNVFSTPDGVDIWRVGQVYTITDQSGNSVRTVVNPTWIDVSVGLGQWPANGVTGPLANVNGNVNQIATSGGIVLTAPFAFGAFYQSYAQSWRVTPEESLLSVCGGAVETGNPQIPFYAISLDPELYNRERAVCTAAGVKGKALLDACTLDVAVIGNDLAAQVFVNARQPVAVGNIFIDPNQ